MILIKEFVFLALVTMDTGTIFRNFTLRVENSWVERVTGISETRNASDVSIYVCIIHSKITFFKKYSVKKNNSKCTRVSMKKSKIRQSKSEIKCTCP